MKKSVITGIVIFVLEIALIPAAVVGIFFGELIKNTTQDKDPITAYEFKNSMQQKGYIITDANNQFSEYDYVKQVYVASSSDNSYQIEFYKFSDENYAMSFYNNNKSIFESSKGAITSKTNTSANNHSKYTLSANGKYMVVSRIDNTVIYVDVDSDYKDVAKELLDELGY